MKKVLFVCLGNICRSPAAEGIFTKLVDHNNLAEVIKVDSAGTSAYHEGEPADARMIEHATNRGFNLTSVSRQFKKSDFEEFDYIVTMDNSNHSNVSELVNKDEDNKKIFKMTDFCKLHSVKQVPDPYTSGPDGFEYVMDILEDACSEFFSHVKKEI